mmetsp:Transcript_20575/g.57097  ORF Transcript_20575/g.57097 Transcript_20575/m.57097 type:complete len:86 (+) Transcript_20575:144-401(+)|eukprot:CAMPEP_0172366590 /NCGR_PEP_ID=MMETSP1060-20121228/16157_1 /TAXON_ID=37318 /ORGANISM="Pseudo-nitzschia pungens, Strain cf. cingulata" /LENGTH=85 /DNA_ID=CAMNT_0013090515 /DNA_START=239 /DNA_END=499 /DNA_ORIENTATION=-
MEVAFDATILKPKTKPFVEEEEEVVVPASALGKLCLKCKKKQMTYECDPCGCPSFCTNCAMKLASGGRCKTCHEVYGGMRRIRDY